MNLQITPAELEIMKVLWKQPGIGAAEIVDALEGEQDWSPRTVKTLLSRLVEKGALKTKADGRRYLYQPAVDEQAYQNKEAGRLIDKLFGGRAAPLVAQLADARGLSDEDIEELEALLGRLKQ
ncbi:MAG: BlaI/MecI/CopY family transcriptional regulator [Pseudomonadota bacterium]